MAAYRCLDVETSALFSRIDPMRDPYSHKNVRRCLPEWSHRMDGQIRCELVRRVRSEIAAGVYDSPERWESALENLRHQLHED